MLKSDLSDSARAAGLEPVTSPVTGECSNQLSYARTNNGESLAYNALFANGVGGENRTLDLSVMSATL